MQAEQEEFGDEFALTEVLQSRRLKTTTGKPADSASHQDDQARIRKYVELAFIIHNIIVVYLYRPLQPLIHATAPAPQFDYSANPSLSGIQDESSFIPYQDSVLDDSNTSKQPFARKPLQSLTCAKSNCSANPSLTSFSVYEDTRDQSSFSVYHDSMQASTHQSSVAPAPVPYFAPLGVPLSHHDQSVSDQTFTQFGIPHPKDFEPVSTPKHMPSGATAGLWWLSNVIIAVCVSELNMDLSAIPCGEQYKGVTRPSQLTPIKEEPSGSSKFSSSSSSRFVFALSQCLIKVSGVFFPAVVLAILCQATAVLCTTPFCPTWSTGCSTGWVVYLHRLCRWSPSPYPPFLQDSKWPMDATASILCSCLSRGGSPHSTW